MTSTLQSLPAELLCQISESCRKNSRAVANLRLTCREIYNKTKFHFAQYHFSEIAVNFTPGGLQRLLKISRDDEFRTFVQKIRLDLIRLVNFYGRDTPSMEDSEVDETAFDERTLAFINGEQFCTLLAESIGRLGNLVGFVVQQPELSMQLTFSELDFFREHWTKLLKSIFSVIIQQQLRLTEFRVEHDNSRTCQPLPSILDEISNVPELFGAMKVLKLGLNVRDTERPESYLPRLMDLLRSTTELRDFSLTFDGSIVSDKFFSHMSPPQGVFENIQRLSVGFIRVFQHDLSRFLRLCTNTLQILELHQVMLTSGAWSEIFTLILNEMNLSQLDLFNIFELDRKISFKKIHRERPYTEEITWHDIDRGYGTKYHYSDENSLDGSDLDRNILDDSDIDRDILDDNYLYWNDLDFEDIDILLNERDLDHSSSDDSDLDEGSLDSSGIVDESPDESGFHEQSVNRNDTNKDVHNIDSERDVRTQAACEDQEEYKSTGLTQATVIASLKRTVEKSQSNKDGDLYDGNDVKESHDVEADQDAYEFTPLGSFQFVTWPGDFFESSLWLKDGDGENIKDWIALLVDKHEPVTAYSFPWTY